MELQLGEVATAPLQPLCLVLDSVHLVTFDDTQDILRSKFPIASF